MRKVLSVRILLTVLTFLVAGSVVAGAVEHEGPHHQDQVYHCVTCCTNHHPAAPDSQAIVQPPMTAGAPSPTTDRSLCSQTVIRVTTPPPKFLV